MNRETYLLYRTNNTPEPLYEYYKENYKEGKPFLDLVTFFQAMQLWEHSIEVFHNVMRYYDIKFNIIIITDIKTGRIIKFV
jgi:hypothetical protein